MKEDPFETIIEDLLSNKETRISVQLNDCYQLGTHGASLLAAALRNNTHLKSLTCYNNDIGPEGAFYISQSLLVNTSLTELLLSANNIQDRGVQHISEMLKTNTALQKLRLYGNNVSQEGAAYLSEALETKNTTLKTLLVDYNNIGNKGVQSLVKVINNNTHLTHLDISYNKIDDTGAAYLSEGLKRKNCKLKMLDLSYNHIHGIGTWHLAQSLIANSSIRYLNLGYNNIGGEGARALAEALTINNSLNKLYLGGTGIREGVKGMARSLSFNQGLTDLDLNYINMSDEDFKFLAAALVNNVTLVSLNLRGNKCNSVASPEKKRIEAILIENSKLSTLPNPQVIRSIQCKRTSQSNQVPSLQDFCLHAIKLLLQQNVCVDYWGGEILEYNYSILNITRKNSLLKLLPDELGQMCRPYADPLLY